MTFRKKTATKPARSKLPSNTELDEIIEEATVDAYDKSGQTVGFYTMLNSDHRRRQLAAIVG